MSAQNSNHIIDVIKLDDDLWLKGVQDEDVGPADKHKCKIYKTHDGRKFKHIWHIANKIYKKMDENRNRFTRLQSKAVDSSDNSSIK